MAYIDELRIEKGQSSTRYTLRDKETNELLSHVVGVVTNLYSFESANKNTILTLSGTSSNNEWDTSTYIPVEPGKVYKFQWWKTAQDGTGQWDNGETRYLFYTDNNVGGAIIDTEQTAPNSGLANGATAPAGAKYLRVSIKKVYKASENADAVAIDASVKGVVAETALFPDEYCAPGTKIYRYADDLVTEDELSVKANAIDVAAGLAQKANASDVEAAIALKTDKAEHETDIGRIIANNPDNLYDPDKRYVGKNLDSTGKLIDAASYDVSNFIPVVPGTTYYGKVWTDLGRANDPQWGSQNYFVNGGLYALYSAKSEDAFVTADVATKLVNGLTIDSSNTNVAYMRVAVKNTTGYPVASQFAVIAAAIDSANVPPEYPKPYKFVDELVLSDELNDRVTPIEEDLQTKASKIGSEPQLVAGMSERLMSTKGREDSDPYSFRTVNSKEDIVSINEIIGGTICWHQMTSAKNTAIDPPRSDDNSPINLTTAEGGQRTFTSRPAFDYVTRGGHKYLAMWTITNAVDGGGSSGTEHDEYRVSFAGRQPTLTVENGSFAKIMEGDESGSGHKTNVYVFLRDSNSATSAITVTNLMLFDLTQMFGSAVADYIYRLEAATAGAGVAFFREMFPATYYPYNAGELVSVQTSGRKTVGFNLFDPSTATTGKSINASGIVQTYSADRSSISDYIPVFPNTKYCVYYSAQTYLYDVIYYDASKTFIGHGTHGTSWSTPFVTETTPSNCAYVRLNVFTHELSSACFNISDPSRNGTYEPYSTHTYPLDSTMTLRGVPVLTDGKVAYDGDKYAPDGTVTRRYGIVDLGTLTWSIFQSTAGIFIATISGYRKTAMDYAPDFICESAKYTPIRTTNSNGIIAAQDKVIVHLNPNNTICIKDSEYGSDASALAASLSGVYLVYELATPTTETAVPYQSIQIAGNTEEFIDDRPIRIKVGHRSVYSSNLRDDLEDVLDSLDSSGLEYPYVFLKNDKTLTIDGAAADAKATSEAINKVTYGQYADFGAGQLVSKDGIVDNTPYSYRANKTDSDRVTISQITGGTVVWNQLAHMPSSYTTDNEPIHLSSSAKNATFSGSGYNYTTYAHKYLVTITVSNAANGGSDKFGVQAVGISIPAFARSIENGSYAVIVEGNPNGSVTKTTVYVYLSSSASDTAAMDVTNVQLFDLTQMFGSAVADYIYGLETATAGAGVGMFRQLFPESYYPYNAGELLSVQTSGKKTIGFNLCDEEFVQGDISQSDGTDSSSPSVLRSKNYIKVIPGQEYYAYIGTVVGVASPQNVKARWYDSEKNYIGYKPSVSPNATFTVPERARYLRICTQSGWGYGITYRHDICINVSDPARNGTYEPHSVYTYPLFPVELHGISKISDGNIIYSGDSYASSGTVVKKYGIVDLGTLTWSRGGTNGEGPNAYRYFGSGIENLIRKNTANTVVPDWICIYSNMPNDTMNNTYRGITGVSVDTDGRICYTDGFKEDGTTFKSYISGTWLVYELGTPVVETVDPYQEIQIAGTTEEFIDAENRGVSIPVGTISMYQRNLRKGLEDILNGIDKSDIKYPYTFLKESESYANLASGQMISNTGLIDTIPYTCRPNETESEFVTLQKIIGGTVAFNQMIRNGNFESKDDWSVTGGNGFAVENNIASIRQASGKTFVQLSQKTTTPNVVYPANHVIFSTVTMKVSGFANVLKLMRGSSGTSLASYVLNPVSDRWYTLAGLRKGTSEETTFVWRMDITENWSADTTLYAKNAMSFDLTRMLGEDVANYIYNLEYPNGQTGNSTVGLAGNTGAGVALFRSMFPKDYYPCNAELSSDECDFVSVHTSGRKVTGFNLYNKDAAVYNYALSVTTGDIETYDGYCVSDYIKVFKGKPVYIPRTGTTRRWFYNTSKSPVAFINSAAEQIYVPPEDGYIRITLHMSKDPIETICVNYSDPVKNGTYEPYRETTYSMDDSLELLGIPMMIDGKPGFVGDEYLGYGRVNKKYGVVNLSTLSWAYGASGLDASVYRFEASLSTLKQNTQNYMLSDGKYAHVSDANGLVQTPQCVLVGTKIYIRDDTIETTDKTTEEIIAAFVASIANTYMVYELKTTLFVQGMPYRTIQNAGSIEEFLDDRDINVPVGHLSLYQTNVRASIDTLINPDVEITGANPVIVAQAGHNYNCGEISTLSFTPCPNGLCSVRFSTLTSVDQILTIPNVRWPSWFNPDHLTQNATYELNIKDGIYGVVGVWT